MTANERSELMDAANKAMDALDKLKRDIQLSGDGKIVHRLNGDLCTAMGYVGFISGFVRRRYHHKRPKKDE